MRVKRFASAVIGLGRIGQGYDYDRSGDSLVVTHATGFACHEGYDLIAGVDPDRAQQERFERKFGRPAYADIQTLMAQCRPEIVSICVPTADHARVFEEVIEYRPRAVLCEKPIARYAAEAKHMVALAEQTGCALVVNYMRRFEPGVLALRQAIQHGEVGEIYKGTVWYSKGLLNSGSHFVDLLRFILGEVTETCVIRDGREWEGQDPEPDVCLRFSEAPVYLLAAQEECFSIGEVVLVGTQGMIRYAEKGALIEVRRPQASRGYPGESVRNQDTETIPTDLRRYQWHVLEALYRHLIDGTPLNSDGQSATETLAVIENIFELLGNAR